MLVLFVKPKPGVRPVSSILHYIEFISYLCRKHLIVSIGGECYVTLAKGQIIPPDSAAVPGGGHVLIIPISHHPTYSTIPPDLAPPIMQETDK
jgi:Protein similar to CwfJ C-terminus 1